jgi:hypothetical protein
MPLIMERKDNRTSRWKEERQLIPMELTPPSSWGPSFPI